MDRAFTLQWQVLFDLAPEFALESDQTKYLSGYFSLVLSNLRSKTSTSKKKKEIMVIAYLAPLKSIGARVNEVLYLTEL